MSLSHRAFHHACIGLQRFPDGLAVWICSSQGCEEKEQLSTHQAESAVEQEVAQINQEHTLVNDCDHDRRVIRGHYSEQQ